MTILNLMTGVLLLLAGRRLFWVSVACVGFIVAYRFTVETGVPGPAWITWAAPLGIGLIGAIVALVYQKVAVILIGFMIGGLVVTDLFQLLGVHGGNLSWLVLLAGGLAGAIAMLFVFDWALIVLSSLAGAFVITPSMGL
ncbi:MAG: TMEM198/TM7SF3 family protein, partial [Proteobacteria bacterium]|nr:TMEM198/TM7SF3 family protein [Pseudomonadota bacterium]MBU1585023.1 TMEM198/TM7SF3 family protein [Pseudomonadota bacterium]MBU2455303.1 TMEM198/TM7SF3 family protein [Pseudomonadota bacterium]